MAAFVAIALSLAMMITAAVLLATRSSIPVWLLWLEGLGLVTTALLIRAELRDSQRHTVK